MTDAEKSLIRLVRRSAGRRHRAEAAALALGALSLLLFGAALVYAASSTRILPAPSSWTLGMLLAFLFAAAVAALSRLVHPVRERAEAKRLDDALGLKDRLSSAVSFLSLPERAPLEELAVRDAETRLADVERFRESNAPLRRAAKAFAVAVGLSAAVLGAGQIGRLGGNPAAAGGPRLSSSAKTPDAGSPGATKPSGPAKPATTDNGLVPVGETKLKDEAAASTLAEAQLKELEKFAGETSEADRLLAQSAYLDESELSGDGQEKGRDDRDTVTMKEPDVDMIKEMVKDAEKRKKEGEDQRESSSDINLEVLIKSHQTSAKPPDKTGDQSTPPGSGEGTSQDTRIKPRRVEVAASVEFRITSVRSLNPPGSSGEKRIVLSEAVMRMSGAPEPPLVETKPLAAHEVRAEPQPRVAQAVPALLRALVSKYFEGLRELEKQTQP